jgi:hypothetical protein
MSLVYLNNPQPRYVTVLLLTVMVTLSDHLEEVSAWPSSRVGWSAAPAGHDSPLLGVLPFVQVTRVQLEPEKIVRKVLFWPWRG